MITSAFVVGVLASCTQLEKPAAPAHAPRIGSRVSTVGKVTLHPGQPCTPQIMFDLRVTGARGTVQLAAPMAETRVLTEAAQRNRRVRVWGIWQDSGQPGCNFISVSKVESLSIAVMF